MLIAAVLFTTRSRSGEKYYGEIRYGIQECTLLISVSFAVRCQMPRDHFVVHSVVLLAQ